MPDKDDLRDWGEEDAYWAMTYQTRPYFSSLPKDYEYYQPAYRYGYEAANIHKGRKWEDLESDLSRSWDSYEYRGESTWEQIKGAVRDAWERVTGKHTVGTRS